MSKRGRPGYVLPDWCCRKDDDLLWCAICLEATENSDRSKLGAFVAHGSTAKKSSAACRGHADSKFHQSVIKSKTNQPSIDEMGRHQRQQVSSRRVNFFVKLFDIVFYLAYFAEPFTHFLRLKERDERNGVFKGFEDLMSNATATYNSATFYMEALRIIETIVWKMPVSV